MKKKYLLPCQCGEKITIEISQAGQQITCQCGASIEAPAMRGFRDLEQVEESADALAEAAKSGSWNRVQGVLFALGIAIAVVSFVFAAWPAYGKYEANEYYAYFLTEESGFDELFSGQLDLMPIEDIWDVWAEARDIQLGPQEPPLSMRARKRSENMALQLNIALIFGGIGLAIAVGAFFVGSPKRKRAP